ncbi:MAG: hypothetical protein LBJ96_05560 [Holosporaceae bacterium]|jgi:hypothetical protein|nr:hypothetical protein [Holosporaceae bacterium]
MVNQKTDEDYKRYVNPFGNVYSKKISLGELLNLVTMGKTRVHMVHAQYEPAVFSIFPRKSEGKQTKTTEPKQTSSSKTIGPIEEPEIYLKTILLEEVPCEKAENGEPVFEKSKVINWFEARRAADKDFPFFLSEKFVADYKRRNKDFVSYDDLKRDRDQWADRCAFLEKRLAKLESEHNLSKKDFILLLATQLKREAEAKGIDMSIPFDIEVISHFLGIEVSKGDTVYNPGGAKIKGFSYDLISKYLNKTELFPEGARGNADKEKKADREEDLKKIKDVFSGKEYQKLKDDFSKIK